MFLFSKKKKWIGSLEHQRRLLPSKAAHGQLRDLEKQDVVTAPQPNPTPGGLQSRPCCPSPLFYSARGQRCQPNRAHPPAPRQAANTVFQNPGGEAGEEAVQLPGKHIAEASSISRLSLGFNSYY